MNPESTTANTNIISPETKMRTTADLMNHPLRQSGIPAPHLDDDGSKLVRFDDSSMADTTACSSTPKIVTSPTLKKRPFSPDEGPQRKRRSHRSPPSSSEGLEYELSRMEAKIRLAAKKELEALNKAKKLRDLRSQLTERYHRYAELRHALGGSFKPAKLPPFLG